MDQQENTPFTEFSEVPLGPPPPAMEIRLVDVYDYGFQDGLLAIEGTPLLDYIRAANEQQCIREELQAAEESVRAKKTEIQYVSSSRERLLPALHEALHKQSVAQHTLLHAQSGVAQVQALIGAATDYRKGNPPHFGWFITFVFLAGAFIFIGVDWVLAESIFAQAFHLKPIEAAVFACGICATSLIFKPYIDRFYEKHYEKSENKQAWRLRIHWLLMGIVLAAVTMLVCLAVMRVDVLKENAVLKQRELAMGPLKDRLSQNTISVEEYTLESRKIAEEYPPKNAKEVPFVHFLAIILATVLFPIAGAICLTLGSNSGMVIYRRWMFGRLRRKKQKVLMPLEKEALACIAEAGKTTAEVNKITDERALLPAQEVLLAVLEKLTAHRDKLRQQYFSAMTEAETALYKEARLRGGEYELDKPLVGTIRAVRSAYTGRGGGTSGGEKKQPSPLYNGRLYQAIRNMITDKNLS